MENIPVEELEEQNAIERIKLDTKKSVAVKRTLIAETKKSFAQRKQSSFKTILSLSNLMIGSSILVLPLRFYSSGYGSSIMAVCVMAFFTCITARIISYHLKSEEKDFIEAIERVLGKGWRVTYLIGSQILLWLSGIIYFLVVSNIIYSIVLQLFDTADLPSKDTITYKTFSYQWTGAILIFLCSFLFNLRDLKIVLKISSKGIYCIAFYFLFITYLAIKSFIDGKVSFGYQGNPNPETIYFTQCGFKSFLQALGVFTLSFMVHNVLSPIIKANKSQRKNPRDIAISFVFGSSLLIYAGFIGLLAVFWREVTAGGEIINASNANTVMDLFDSSDKFVLVLLVISEALLCLQLTSIICIIGFLARTQLFNLVYGPEGIPSNWAFYGFSTFFSILIYGFQIFNFKPIVLIEYAGTLGGYMIIYLLPSVIHIYSISKLNKKVQMASLSIESSDQSIVAFHKMKERQVNEAFLSSASAATLFLEDQKTSKLPVIVKYISYGSVLLYGTLLILIQFTDVECS